VSSFHSPCRVEFHSINLVESRTVQIVFNSVLNSVEDTLVECQLNTVEIIQSRSLCSSFHLWCSVIMKDSTYIELHEQIVGNPAYTVHLLTLASRIQFRSNSKNPDKLNVEKKTFSHVLAGGPTRE